MSQMTKEQAAKVLLNYQPPESKLTCSSCQHFESRCSNGCYLYECQVLLPEFGLMFYVKPEGQCDRHKKREPL